MVSLWDLSPTLNEVGEGMQAQTPVPMQAWDDEINLRQVVEAIWRQRWLVVGLVTLAVAVAGVTS